MRFLLFRKRSILKNRLAYLENKIIGHPEFGLTHPLLKEANKIKAILLKRKGIFS